MPRKPRIHFNGAVYHVMLRGNAGQDIFTDDADRLRFLLLLQQGIERYRCLVHAYCLMDNHVHLAVQVSDIPLSKLMQVVSFRYTQYMNRRFKRTGHLFQGRFKALLIDQDNYLLQLVRYIHLNPYRAGMVQHPDQYSWSSHHVYGGKQTVPWLTTDWVLEQLGTERKTVVSNYISFINDGLSEGHRKEFHRGSFEGRALGDDSFVQHALLQAEQPYVSATTVDNILDLLCREYAITREELKAPGRRQPFSHVRAIAAWLVKQSIHLQLKELGDVLERDLSGLSHAARRLELEANWNGILKKRLVGLKEKVDKSVCQA